MHKCRLDFIEPLDVYNYILINCNGNEMNNSAFKLVDILDKHIVKENPAQEIVW